MPKTNVCGQLKIGDDWNAIRIIALSQTNPLKAIAEFVENSIDAEAKSITIVRGRERGSHYLTIKDDGSGVPRGADGLPDFKYVATHICDSVKRRLKTEGIGPKLQGEFGIGLLSFWTVGETLTMTSMGADQRAYQMTMSKGDPGYSVSQKRLLFDDAGTEVQISPLLEGIRSLSGEKIQWYLASELRDRIRDAQVRVTVIDRLARKRYEVEPRQFEGRLLHQLPLVHSPYGDGYAELYLTEPGEDSRVALSRGGTRVIEDIASLPGLDHAPWTSRYVQGLIDVPFLDLTPGTRSGIIQDERYAALIAALQPLESHVDGLVEEQRRAEEEQATQQSLRAIQRAFHQALLALPREEYAWFSLRRRALREGGGRGHDNDAALDAEFENAMPGLIETPDPRQIDLFDYAGPLYRVEISPAAMTVALNQVRKFRALPQDRAQRHVQDGVWFAWRILEGGGLLQSAADEEVEFRAPATPGLARLQVTVTQRDVSCSAEALVTITESLPAPLTPTVVTRRGLPGYTFERAAGELWRCRFDAARNIIVVNGGHRDFVFATRNRATQLRYLMRLYVKELVLRNFAELPADQLLERMIELSLHAEAHLKFG
jgi:Histidine kinase-, DNA gyrase B-, and HSP90-like ATPase